MMTANSDSGLQRSRSPRAKSKRAFERSAAPWIPVAALAFVVLAGCGRTQAYRILQPCVFDSECATGLRCVDQVCRVLNEGDGGKVRGGKRFGETCAIADECNSNLCVGGPTGNFCTSFCGATDAGCPSSYVCKDAWSIVTAT